MSLVPVADERCFVGAACECLDEGVVETQPFEPRSRTTRLPFRGAGPSRERRKRSARTSAARVLSPAEAVVFVHARAVGDFLKNPGPTFRLHEEQTTCSGMLRKAGAITP